MALEDVREVAILVYASMYHRLFVVCQNRVFLCNSSDCPRTFSVDHAGLYLLSAATAIHLITHLLLACVCVSVFVRVCVFL